MPTNQMTITTGDFGIKTIQMPYAPYQLDAAAGVSVPQAISRVSSGHLVTYTKGAYRPTKSITHHGLSRFLLDEFIEFFQIHAKGSRRSWSGYDETGATYTAKFTDQSISWDKDGPSTYSVSFNIEILS